MYYQITFGLITIHKPALDYICKFLGYWQRGQPDPRKTQKNNAFYKIKKYQA